MAASAMAPSMATLPKINSETNFAVCLLLSVGRNARAESERAARHLDHTDSNGGASTEGGETRSEMSDATDESMDGGAHVIPAKLNLLCQVSSPIGKPKHQGQQNKGVSKTKDNALSTVRHVAASRNGVTFKYTHEERQQALQRFREKKRRRHYEKRVRYMVRKTLACSRPRYKGRFARPPPGENYDDGTPGPVTASKAAAVSASAESAAKA